MNRAALVIVGIVVASASAAPALKALPVKATPLAGTAWIGTTAEGWMMTIDFRDNGTMTVSYNKTRFSTATWKQDADKIYWEMNNKYCEFEGKMNGDTIEGESHNVVGKKWTTKMTRVKPDH